MNDTALELEAQGALMGSPKNRSIKYSLSDGLEKVPHVLKKK